MAALPEVITMTFPDEQVEELKLLCQGVEQAGEGPRTFFYLPGLTLPGGCKPSQSDALLCPTEMDGYPSRLFFAVQVQGPVSRNWNANGVRILEKNWHAFSWKVSPNLRLAQMVAAHLKGLR
jgi:hypothetical protein